MRPRAVLSRAADCADCSAILFQQQKVQTVTVQPMNCSSPCAGCSAGQDACVCHRPTRRAALLLNLGTPDSTNVRDVRRYLREFLGDPFVIDLTKRWDWLRPLLATMIAHFRGPKSAEAYASI